MLDFVRTTGQRYASPLWRLTRAPEHLPFVLPLTLLGALTASYSQELPLSAKLAFVTTANVLAVVYAFMINDIEDAEDDLRNPQARWRNPIAAGAIERSTARWAALLVAALSLMLYAFISPMVLLVGVGILALGDFYSRPPFRLKARPVVDVASHVSMLGGLLCLAGILAQGGSPGAGWWLVSWATAFSAYGQLYNQVRDYQADQRAGLANSADWIGLKWTYRAMLFFVALAAICMLCFLWFGEFPLWLAGALLAAVVLSRWIGTARDARGSEANVGGSLQQRGLFVLNFIAFSWLVAELLYPVVLGG
ncbi:MAG: UbiA family prenyltransferase [Anaerolineales bacterium]